jgi:hypothetical protein
MGKYEAACLKHVIISYSAVGLGLCCVTRQSSLQLTGKRNPSPNSTPQNQFIETLIFIMQIHGAYWNCNNVAIIIDEIHIFILYLFYSMSCVNNGKPVHVPHVASHGNIHFWDDYKHCDVSVTIQNVVLFFWLLVRVSSCQFKASSYRLFFTMYANVKTMFRHPATDYLYRPTFFQLVPTNY